MSQRTDERCLLQKSFPFLKNQLIYSVPEGIIPRIFGPIFECLKQNEDRCGFGFIQIMLNLMSDTDLALKMKNPDTMGLLFKTFANLFQMQLPFIRDQKLYDAFVQAVEGNKQQEAALASSGWNTAGINAFFAKASNLLNDNQHGCRCRCDSN